MSSGFAVKPEERTVMDNWVTGLGDFDKPAIGVAWYKQGWGKLGMSRSILEKPLCLAGKQYAWGLGTHADGEIAIHSTKPLKTFRAFVGVDDNSHSHSGDAIVVFSIFAGGKILAESGPLNVLSEPQKLEAELDGTTEIVLAVKSQNTIHLAHTDWVEAEVVTVDGETLKIGTPETSFLLTVLPVSFKYNGMDSETWFRKWGITHTQADGKDFVAHKYICSDSDTSMECTMELQAYKNFPACLWNVYFKNTGKTATPILEDVKPLDLKWLAEKATLYRAYGAFHYENEIFSSEAFRDDFKLIKDDLARTPEITMGGIGGRSSVDWMPYFNFAGKGEGLMFGVGWTGQWQSKIKFGISSIHFQAGMEFIHTTLKPGESIRQPSILMIYWTGNDSIRGNNLLRRFMQENLMPRDAAGEILQTPACCSTWGGMIEEHHLDRVRNIGQEKLNYDYYWIDAGWYGKAGPNESEFTPEWCSQAGDWSINRETYPNEFKAISSTIHKIGKKFLLWFEPERAICGTPITLEHPEYFFGEKIKRQNLLLDLGNPDAWKWCTELVAGMIKEQGIDCYRQDFNFSPLPYWQKNDAPDRVGISEIRHVEGLYAFLDELRQRFPNLLIDNCASGGRRLDFEMMRRGIPLWASDMQCFPDCIAERNQQLVQGLSMWIPQFSFGTQKHPGDTYHFRSTMAAGVVAHLFPYEADVINPQYPYQWLQERLAEYHRAKVFFTGDFYPMLALSDTFDGWTAYQFDRPDLDGGIIEVFRKPESLIEKVRFELHNIDTAANYEIENVDTKRTLKISGEELIKNGWPVEIEKKRDSRLYFYKKIK